MDASSGTTWPPLEQMSWRDFERAMAVVFEHQGYHTTITPDGADGGVDLILQRPGERILVQCKHWKAWTVRVQTVRELAGVMTVKGATGGIVVTSKRFTGEARDFARQSGIRLIEGPEVRALLRATPPPPGFAVSASPMALQPGQPRCPRCGEPMVLRTTSHGPERGQQFWGCPRFPNCRGISPVTSVAAPGAPVAPPRPYMPPSRRRSPSIGRVIAVLAVTAALPLIIMGVFTSGIFAIAFAPVRAATATRAAVPTLVPQLPAVPSALPKQSLDPKVTATIALPVTPNKVAVDPDLHRLYVTAVETNSLIIVDTAANAVLSTVTLQRQPGEIAVDTTSHTLWVTNYNDASITLLDRDGGDPTLLATGNGPAGVAIDPTLHTAYVPNALDKTITAYDTTTRKPTKTVTAYGRYSAATVDTVTHTVCFVSEWLATPYCYDRTLKSTGTLNVSGGSVAIDSVTHGHYGVDPSRTEMTVVDGTTGKRSSIVVGTTPTGVAVDPGTHLVYVTDHDRRSVAVVKPI